MIKVLRVITRLNVGGPSKQILTMNSIFDSPGYDQLIVTGQILDSELEVDLSKYGQIVKLEELQRGFNPLKDIKVIKQLMNIMKIYEPEIIHTHLSKAWMLATITRILNRSKIKSIHTFHGHILHSYFSNPVIKIFTLIQKVLAKKTDVLVAVNPTVRDQLIEKGIGDKSKFKVIYPGFDSYTTLPKLIAKSKLGLNLNGLVVGYIGRFEPIKRTDILAEVIKITTSENTDIQFLICGEGSLYPEFVESTFGERVYRLGWIDDLTAFYSAVDLMILTSDNEGSPLTIIEAGKVGIPTISRDVGGVNSLIEDGFNGFLCANSAAEISVLLQEICLDSELIQRVSKNVKLDFNLRFNKETFLQKYEEIYSGQQ